MESSVNLEAAGEIDRKYFLAFLKGLAQIKYKDLYSKLRAREGETSEQVIELEVLYQDLFDPNSFPADKFNSLVEGGMRVITELLEANMNKE